MSLLFRQSVGQIKCEIVGHRILPEEQEKLFKTENRKLYTRCDRCNAYLLLKVNQKNENEYFVIEE